MEGVACVGMMYVYVVLFLHLPDINCETQAEAKGYAGMSRPDEHQILWVANFFQYY